MFVHTTDLPDLLDSFGSPGLAWKIGAGFSSVLYIKDQEVADIWNFSCYPINI